MSQPAKTENMSLHNQKRYKYSWTATTYACSPQAPVTNTIGVENEKVTVEKQSEKATLLVLLDLSALCLPFLVGGFYIVFVITNKQVSSPPFLSFDPL